jgi:15-cis-phytoene synthase
MTSLVHIPAVEVECAYQYCEQITRREAANFYYGIRLLPREKRLAMSAVYAFARLVDDIGDEGGEQPTQLAALASLRGMLTALEERDIHIEDPLLVALAHAQMHYQLPLDALGALIDGVEQDVIGMRYENFDQLVGYCRHVAGSIGRLCLAIFTNGTTASLNGSNQLADDLGVAMQLTNILRDVREDRERGRTYLPAQDLERFGVDDLSGESAARLIRYEAERAAHWFDRGMRLVDHLDPRSAACVLAMTGIYRTILERITEDPAQVLQKRISLPAWEKTWVAVRSLAAARPGAGAQAANGQGAPS